MQNDFQTLDDFLQEETQRDPAFLQAIAETHLDDRLGLELAMVRERQGLTQRELANRAGISQPMLNRIERGNQIPKISTLWKILCALQAHLNLDPLHNEIQVASSGILATPGMEFSTAILPVQPPSIDELVEAALSGASGVYAIQTVMADNQYLSALSPPDQSVLSSSKMFTSQTLPMDAFAYTHQQRSQPFAFFLEETSHQQHVLTTAQQGVA